MRIGEIDREVEISTFGETRDFIFDSAVYESIHLKIPPTVYPPRRDTEILVGAINRLKGETGFATEIGCGSGAISISLARRGWRVNACDINPLAVAATRGNAIQNDVADLISVEEGGPGEEQWFIPDDTDLLVWNIPYLLSLDSEASSLGPMEEASLSDRDEQGGWSAFLLECLEKCRERLPGILVILLLRIDPVSPSKSSDWHRQGWASRCLITERLGDETLEARCFWRPGNGREAELRLTSDSTMDDARMLPTEGWQRLRAVEQKGGRGRRGAEWRSEKGDMTATWSLNQRILKRIDAGLLQTSIGAEIASRLLMDCKWPNDLMHEGEKAGGILLESGSNQESIRVGVGINRYPGEFGGAPTSGWSETIGESEAEAVFRMVDAAIASIAENHSRLPHLSTSELMASTWSNLSRSISTGMIASTKTSEVRIAGLEKSGELQILDSYVMENCGDVDGILMTF